MEPQAVHPTARAMGQQDVDIVDLTSSPPRNQSTSQSNCSSAMRTPQETREWGKDAGAGAAAESPAALKRRLEGELRGQAKRHKVAMAQLRDELEAKDAALRSALASEAALRQDNQHLAALCSSKAPDPLQQHAAPNAAHTCSPGVASPQQHAGPSAAPPAGGSPATDVGQLYRQALTDLAAAQRQADAATTSQRMLQASVAAQQVQLAAQQAQLAAAAAQREVDAAALQAAMARVAALEQKYEQAVADVAALTGPDTEGSLARLLATQRAETEGVKEDARKEFERLNRNREGAETQLRMVRAELERSRAAERKLAEAAAEAREAEELARAAERRAMIGHQAADSFLRQATKRAEELQAENQLLSAQVQQLQAALAQQQRQNEALAQQLRQQQQWERQQQQREQQQQRQQRRQQQHQQDVPQQQEGQQWWAEEEQRQRQREAQQEAEAQQRRRQQQQQQQQSQQGQASTSGQPPPPPDFSSKRSQKPSGAAAGDGIPYFFPRASAVAASKATAGTAPAGNATRSKRAGAASPCGKRSKKQQRRQQQEQAPPGYGQQCPPQQPPQQPQQQQQAGPDMDYLCADVPELGPDSEVKDLKQFVLQAGLHTHTSMQGMEKAELVQLANSRVNGWEARRIVACCTQLLQSHVAHLAIFRVRVQPNATLWQAQAAAALQLGSDHKVRKVYKELTLKVHPDKGGADDQAVATEAFRALCTAHAKVLELLHQRAGAL